MESYIAIAFSALAVVLCIVILVKVNKILDNLHTPIVKKLTPDMNLRPSARRSIGPQEMAQRGEKNNKEARKGGQNKENRGDKPQQSGHKDRNEQRDGRPNRRDRRENRPERNNRREMNGDVQASAVEAKVDPVVEVQNPAPEGRRPLAPRVPVETPAAPISEPQVSMENEVDSVETTFDPAKVRYGRRNVIKRAPELSDEV